MKLVVFDMDGTLLSEFHQISEYNRKAFRELYHKGYHLGIATGRRVSNIEEILGEDLKYFDVLLGENGHQTKDLKTNEVITTKMLSNEDILDIIQTLDSDDCNFCFFDHKGVTMGKNNHIPERMYDIHGDNIHYLDYHLWQERSKICMPVNPELKDEYRQRVESIKDKPYHGVMTGPGFFEFMSVETSKWKSLEKYLERYHYSKEDVIGFGDSGNDFEFLSNVGFAVGMNNADEQLKKICDAITEYPNTQDGVGHYIIDHLL